VDLVENVNVKWVKLKQHGTGGTCPKAGRRGLCEKSPKNFLAQKTKPPRALRYRMSRKTHCVRTMTKTERKKRGGARD